MDSQERSRKNLSSVLKALASAGQRRVAEALGVHESTVSKMKSEGEFDRFCLLLAECGLKVVPIEMRCYPEKDLVAILTLAKRQIEQMDGVRSLAWGDD